MKTGPFCFAVFVVCMFLFWCGDQAKKPSNVEQYEYRCLECGNMEHYGTRGYHTCNGTSLHHSPVGMDYNGVVLVQK